MQRPPSLRSQRSLNSAAPGPDSRKSLSLRNLEEDPFLTAGLQAPSRGQDVSCTPLRAACGTGRQAQAQEDPFATPVKDQRNRIPDPYVQRNGPLQFVLLGAHVPAVVLVVLLFCFTYVYHVSPATPWIIALIALDFLLISNWPAAVPGRNAWDWLPLTAALASVWLGVWLGLLNYATIEPWVHAERLASHSNVNPTANPLEYADAGILSFAEGSKLDVASAAGFRAWPHTYCAAPVVSDAANPGPVGFWAVGMNCCSNRGDFHCDDADDASVRSGLRVETHSLGHSAGQLAAEHFRQAVHMSAAVNDLTVARAPIYVVWHGKPKEVAQAAFWGATSTFVGLAVIAICACAGVQGVITKVRRMQH